VDIALVYEEAVECPECKVKTHRVFLHGKQAICINNKCNIDRFTVQHFDDTKGRKDDGKRNQSFNNSGR